MHINTNDGYSGDINRHPEWIKLREKQQAERNGSASQNQAHVMQRAQLQYKLTEESNGHPKTIAATKAQIARKHAIHQGKIDAARKGAPKPLEWTLPCPTCRVGVKTPCVTRSGHRASKSHISRIALVSRTGR